MSFDDGFKLKIMGNASIRGGRYGIRLESEPHEKIEVLVTDNAQIHGDFDAIFREIRETRKKSKILSIIPDKQWENFDLQLKLNPSDAITPKYFENIAVQSGLSSWLSSHGIELASFCLEVYKSLRG
ncbi:hypothetical protein [Ciceribacter sp. L1K22]|uniref:hypothetical protein n=1 Tax=Ciceribacter sp. L1K22 TaxID=2820275 RepID=UPI001ABDB4DB|nr:hypothetical protein [Ciceribacter sp. L1K22]MBO3758849.1 hypothetical protein [Ciceribacter sp. L1K22]